MKRCLATGIIAIVFVTATACMGDLNQYDECVDVETARCEFRNRCDSGFDLPGCVMYYQEFCRTRKIKTEYSPNSVDACVSDIEGMGNEDHCSRLDVLGSKSEICVFNELASCREFLCLKESESSSSDSLPDTSPDDSDTAPGGLNPY